jgi:light-regulated signal transduction histidine kinase (bacteriophytochrome)
MFEEDYAEILDAKAMKLLGNIQRNAKRMGRLIDDLLEFSKLGRKELVKTNIGMNQLVTEVMKEVSDGKQNTSVITVEDLPDCLADRGLIYQVWVNLISNAIKYSSKKENPVIHIGSKINDNQVVYFIKDNGAGFNMDYAKMLFKVFQRLHSPKEFEGTGIGLAIIARIIAKHGGNVWAEGEVDKGATFFFTISNSR